MNDVYGFFFPACLKASESRGGRYLVDHGEAASFLFLFFSFLFPFFSSRLENCGCPGVSMDSMSKDALMCTYSSFNLYLFEWSHLEQKFY